MRRTFWAIALVTACLATPSRAALPETGCPGSWTGSGEATYYLATTGNACSLPVGPNDYFAAVAEAAYDGSAVCGRCMRITGPLGSVVARITDYCVGAGCRDFDLSPSAFAAIGNPLDGIIPISWESVSCDVEGPISFFYDPGSNPYYAKIQVRNHRYGIAGLSIKTSDGGSFVALGRSIDDAFEYLPGTPILAPLSFQVTDLHGDVLEEPGLAFAPGSEVAGTGQFAFCPEPSAGLGVAAVLVALRLARKS
jgi:expansin (peptidoglycan-binding protein)